MAKQTINVGVTANDRKGDPLRIAFQKTNANFTETYDKIGELETAIQNIGDEIPDVPSDISDLTDNEDLLIIKEHLEVTNRLESDPSTIVVFTKAPNTSSDDVFDQIDTNLSLTRDATGIGGQGGGIYNKALETAWNQIESPLGTLWNLDGWDNLDNVKLRFYEPLRNVFRNRIGENIVGAKLIMYDTINNKYYKFEFSQWQQGADHNGSFAYTRELIDTTNSVGITFPDGSIQVSAPQTFTGFREIYIGDTSQYEIQPKDRGKYIEAFNTTIYVPNEEAYDFPLGSFVFFVAQAQDFTIEVRETANLYGPDGIITQSWTVPARTTATIIKTDVNTWNITAKLPSELNSVSQDIIPSEDSTYNLGSPDKQWNSLYVSANTIFIGGTPISTSNGNLTVDGLPVNESSPYLRLTNSAVSSQPISLVDTISFEKVDYDTGNTAIDFIDSGVALTRGNQNYLYNPLLEESVDRSVSPAGTLWNADGWGDLVDYKTREYSTFDIAFGGNLTEIASKETIMYDVANDNYYAIDFSSWTQGQNGGGFAYSRSLIIDPNEFKKLDYATGNTAIDVFISDDPVGAGIGITRGNNQGIYNPYQESSWNSEISPAGTLWNADGWADLSNLTERSYTNFYAAVDGNLGENVIGKELVLYIPNIDAYYAAIFTEWTPNNAGGGFTYFRRSIDPQQVNEGIKFSDGSVQKTAYTKSNVLSKASGQRSIETAVGSKTVSVTQSETNTYTGQLSRTTEINFEIYVTRTEELDDILLPINQGSVNPTLLEISIDGGNTYNPAFLSSLRETEYWFYYSDNNQPVPQTQGEEVLIRISVGADPVVWWDKRDLPSGSNNFRGAIIDYHAFTGDGTIIGTIHIADDAGNDNITHTEVFSGSSNMQNNDLWVVNEEGKIAYQRLDKQANTLKIHWTAKAFYGREYYD